MTSTRKKPLRKSKRFDGQSKSKILAEISETSGIAENCHFLLKKMCTYAAQFQKHSHREKLLASDICKASQYYLGSNVFNEAVGTEMIDIKSYIDETDTYVTSEEFLYCGKYLNPPNFENLKNDSYLVQYFNIVMKAAFSNDDAFLKVVLLELKKNFNIQPLIPIFVDNICDDLVMMTHDRNHLNNFLLILQSLYSNVNLYFQSKTFLKLSNFVIFCATSSLSSLSSPFEGYFSFRDTAARFLGEILLSRQSGIIYENILDKIVSNLKSPELKFASCYGTLSALIAAGALAIARVIPSTFLDFSIRFKDFLKLSSSEVATKNKLKFLEVCAILVKYYLFEAVISSEESLGFNVTFSYVAEMEEYEHLESITLNLELCCDILNYFGEEINSYLPKLKNHCGEEILIKDFIGMLVKNKH